MAKLVSKTYADALFELAVEKGCEDAWLEDAKALLEILHENEELAIDESSTDCKRREASDY